MEHSEEIFDNLSKPTDITSVSDSLSCKQKTINILHISIHQCPENEQNDKK